MPCWLETCWTIIGRWEHVTTTQQGSDAFDPSEGDLTAFTLGVRYTIEFSNRAAVTLVLEGSQVTTTVSGSKPKGSTVLAGVDFAF